MYIQLILIPNNTEKILHFSSNNYLSNMTKVAQIKCPACSEWVSSDSNYCSKCNSLLDRNELLKKEREQISGPVKVKPKSRVDLFIERTAESQNPFVRVFRFFVQVLWFVYVSLIAFVIWFVTLLVG